MKKFYRLILRDIHLVIKGSSDASAALLLFKGDVSYTIECPDKTPDHEIDLLFSTSCQHFGSILHVIQKKCDLEFNIFKLS